MLKAEDKAEVISFLAIGQYIAAVYDDQWWLGTILEVDNKHDDFKVRFLRPAGPSPTYRWPEFEDHQTEVENVTKRIPGVPSPKGANKLSHPRNTREKLIMTFYIYSISFSTSVDFCRP